MRDLFCSPGTLSGLVLRILQSLFAASSLAVMASSLNFFRFTAYTFLVATMGLQFFWCSRLAWLDIRALRIKRDLRTAELLRQFAIGDWVLATLSLCGACSSAGLAVLYAKDMKYCTRFPTHLPCDRYKISIALAFVTWFLTVISFHVNFWLLGSV